MNSLKTHSLVLQPVCWQAGSTCGLRSRRSSVCPDVAARGAAVADLGAERDVRRSRAHHRRREQPHSLSECTEPPPARAAASETSLLSFLNLSIHLLPLSLSLPPFYILI